MTVVRNPIIPGCFPDPTICRVGEEYFLVTSTFEYQPGLPIQRSRDLVSWELIGHAIDRPGMLDMDGMASSSGLFAPTLRFHDGMFWLVCTLVDQQDASRGGNFLLTATDAAGPWSDPIWLEVDGIDPSIFFDDDGRIWMHGTRLASDPEWFHQTEVWLRELDRETMAFVGEEHILWHGAVIGAVWAEGPHLYKIDGTYYLLASEGGTEFHHALSVARADTVTGPYIGNKANPVLTHRQLGHGADLVGVGHADLVQAVDGSWWSVLLAMRPYGGYHYNLGREVFLVPVSWEEGWPVFAPGLGRVPREVDVPFASRQTLGVMQGAASGTIRSDDPRWTSLRVQPEQIAEREGDGWVMPLSPATLSDATVTAFLGVRQQHRDVDVVATLSCDLVEGEEIGLVVRQSELDHVRMSMSSSPTGIRIVATHRQAGVDARLGEIWLDGVVSDALELSVRAREQDYELSAARPGDESYVVAVADGRTLDSVATGGFLGVWFGVFGTSNGAPTQSRLRVQSFDYTPR
ncbi:alpha-N-arabinofuranosidase [Microbacterium sp. CH12i]|uniref:glycoside hydrolase family 43 protein n=1 Tax=Microbacterium sp. CH12i TaxID=1479651 RepID=UPI000460CE82|nr:glycoside hydrolase family 43 protein [Microbacterium sp. CH12i]KDA06457.1 alpha-N-arabinofuranosidase [Microbacterium sp. CH12i]